MLTVGEILQPEAAAGDKGVGDKVDPDLVRGGGQGPRHCAAAELAQ